MKRRREVSDASPLQEVTRRGMVGVAYVGLAALVAAAGLGTGLAWRLTLAAATGLLLVGIVRLGQARLGLARQRRAADLLLRTGVRVHPQSELLVWRAAELISDRNRRTLARSLNRLVSELERPALVSAVPLNRRGVRPHRALLHALAGRLAELERPVTAQGMVLVEELLTDGYTSPLYLGGHAEDVPRVVNRCLLALNAESSRQDSTGDGVASRLRRVGSGGGV
jgi:hypothetical protein